MKLAPRITLEEVNFTIVTFAFPPIANLGMGKEIVFAGATLKAFIILVKLML